LIPFFSSVGTFLNAFFHSRYSLGWRSLPSFSNWVCSSENVLALSCESGIEYSEFCSAVFGPHLATSWLSSNQIPLPPGIELAFVSSGAFDHGQKSSGPRIDAVIRALTRQMVEGNAGRGAPRVHGELLKLGFDVSECTVSRYLRRLYPREQSRKLRAAFPRNHRDVIVAMDFFTVPTLTFLVLYCLVRAH
jgi:hypothetical protein